MNLYLVSAPPGYQAESYTSFVCVAESEQAARETHPASVVAPADPISWSGTHWSFRSQPWTDYTWAQDPACVRVQLLGTALPDAKPCVVLAAFEV